MDTPKNGAGNSELEALRAENAKLKARNANLYKDCVSFAKLIRAGGKKDEEIEKLQAEIKSLKAQLESLNNVSPVTQDYITQDYISDDDISSESEPDDGVTYNPKVHYVDEETFENQYKENETPMNHPLKKNKNGVLTFFRTFICILFVISLLVSIISGVSYLFCTKYKDYTLGGYRFCTVINNSMSTETDKNGLYLVKYCSFDGIELDSLVVTAKDTRSFAKITGLSVSENEPVAVVKDKNGTYEVKADEFIGKAEMKLPFLGSVVRYASASPYNYSAIVLSVTLFLLALLLLIPSGKPKQPKFGKDYTAEDFTI